MINENQQAEIKGTGIADERGTWRENKGYGVDEADQRLRTSK